MYSYSEQRREQILLVSILLCFHLSSFQLWFSMRFCTTSIFIPRMYAQDTWPRQPFAALSTHLCWNAKRGACLLCFTCYYTSHSCRCNYSASQSDQQARNWSVMHSEKSKTSLALLFFSTYQPQDIQHQEKKYS